MILKAEKEEIVKKFGRKEGDTGSAEVQVALLTKNITALSEHFETHKKDYHSKRGLLKLIGTRKSLLSYLMKTDLTRYQNVLKELGLRK